MGKDEGAYKQEDENSPGGIVIESVSNIRTVASLVLEEKRSKQYNDALLREDPNSLLMNALKGCSAGLGLLVRTWGMALFFWWGGWLIFNHPTLYGFRDFLISMFSLLFSISGMAMAMQGMTDRDEAAEAAERIFQLIERRSEIDPLSEEGKKDV